MSRKQRQEHIHNRLREDLGNLNAMIASLQDDLRNALTVWKAMISIGIIALLATFIIAFIVKAMALQDFWVVSVVGLVFGLSGYISHNVIVHQTRMTSILVQLYSREANTATLKLLSNGMNADQDQEESKNP